MGADVFRLASQPGDPRRPVRQIGDSDIGIKIFTLGRRRRVIVPRRDQLAQRDPRFLARLAPRRFLGGLAAIDPARHRLDQPGVEIAAREGPHAKLLDHQHPVAHRIIGQHHRSIPRQKHRAIDRLAHRAVEPAKAQIVFLDREIIGIGLDASVHRHILRAALAANLALGRRPTGPCPGAAAHQHHRVSGQKLGRRAQPLMAHEILGRGGDRRPPAGHPVRKTPGRAGLPAPAFGEIDARRAGRALPLDTNHPHPRVIAVLVKIEPRQIRIGQIPRQNPPCPVAARDDHRKGSARRPENRMARQQGGFHRHRAAQNPGQQWRVAQRAVKEAIGHPPYRQRRAAHSDNSPASAPPITMTARKSHSIMRSRKSTPRPTAPTTASIGPS